MAGFIRNGWQLSPGMGGRFEPESVAGLARNTQETSQGFILVARASYNYGFPLGIELYDRIIKNYSSQVENYYQKAARQDDSQGDIQGAKHFCAQLSSTAGV